MMKKRIFAYVGELLALSLAVTGLVYASSGSKADSTATELSATDAAAVYTGAGSTTEPPETTASGEEPYDPPFVKTYSYDPTPEEQLQRVKDSIKKDAAAVIANKASYAKLTAERDALLAGRGEAELSASERARLAELDEELLELRLNIPPEDREYTLEAYYLSAWFDLYDGSDNIIKFYKLNENSKLYDTSNIEYRRAIAQQALAVELRERYERGENVESLFLYYFEQVDAINDMR